MYDEWHHMTESILLMAKWHVIVNIIFTPLVISKDAFLKMWLFKIRLLDRQNLCLCLDKAHLILVIQVLWSTVVINSLRIYITHTIVYVHKILEYQQQRKRCGKIPLSLKLLVIMNTSIFRTSLVNESFSWLVYMRANTLFPMKNSSVKAKEKTLWVVFWENKNRVFCFRGAFLLFKVADGYLWGP